MTQEIALDPEADDFGPSPAVVEDAARPIVVVGAHGQSLFMHVAAIPREGETVVASDFEETVDGGKATNQAVAASRYGAPVRFVSVVGNDERGRRILRYLDRERVDRRWVEVVAGNTDVGFVMLSPRGIPAIASCSDLSARLDASFVQMAARAIDGASVVVCQLEAPPACAGAAFEIARGVGAVTVFNPAPMVPLPRGLLELVDILVPNQHEAAALVGLEGALAACLRDGMNLTEAATCAVSAAAMSVTRPGTLEAFVSGEMVAAANDFSEPQSVAIRAKSGPLSSNPA
jgi:ribokinase